MFFYSGYFEDIVAQMRDDFLDEGVPATTQRWQAQDVSSRSEMTPIELRNTLILLNMPEARGPAQLLYRPNLPWAEDHFQERVSGEPLNPPPSNAWWPFAQAGNAEHKDGEIFSHTYPERYWPRMANIGGETNRGRQIFVPHVGIRYEYGDLGDVIRLLTEVDLGTRQAFLPVWFPEDTGAVAGQRVPCSLGYHFMVRAEKLHMSYYIRSCDFVRHFRDDVYMTVRLGHWVKNQLNSKLIGPAITMGELTIHIPAFHCFVGDLPMLTKGLVP